MNLSDYLLAIFVSVGMVTGVLILLAVATYLPEWKAWAGLLWLAYIFSLAALAARKTGV